jgi:hypothetical protein
VTTTGCFILSPLWTKQGLLQRLTNGQQTSSQGRWAGHQERENVLPASSAAVACRARSRREETDAFSAKLKTRNDIQLNRARSRHAHSSSLPKSAESIVSVVWKTERATRS